MSLGEKNQPGRMARKKQATRDKIVETALALFRELGYDGVTMERIAQAADLAKGTLYHYFPVKEAILDQFIHGAFRQKNPARIKKLKHLSDTAARILSLMSELMAGVSSQKEIFEKFLVYRVKTMISLSRENDKNNGLRELGSSVIALGQKSGELRADLPPEIALDWFEFAFIAVARRFYLDPGGFCLEEAVEPCLDLLLRGIKN